MESPDPDRQASELLKEVSVLHLATAGDRGPWCAAVYFAHRGTCFYFVSDPSTRHVSEALAAGTAAGAVSAGSDSWRELRGLQMEGTLRSVTGLSERATALALYLARFPFVPALLLEEAAAGRMPSADPTTLRLFAFEASRVIYRDNRFHLGFHTEVDLSAL